MVYFLNAFFPGTWWYVLCLILLFFPLEKPNPVLFQVCEWNLLSLINYTFSASNLAIICSQAPLEETWEALFSTVRYAKNFSGPVCFRHAIISPLGYETALFKGLTESINCQGTTANILREHPDDMRTARLSEFGEMLRASFGLHGDGMQTKPTTGHNVLFVRREDYLAHPRHSGKVESRLSNEQEVFDSISKWASHHSKCKINMVNGLFAHMQMKEQFQAIQEASVIIGAHGAGLTHLVSATPNTIVLEIISSFYRRPHFSLISQWKGLEYHIINLSGSHAEPDEVIAKLREIMRSLGCWRNFGFYDIRSIHP